MCTWTPQVGKIMAALSIAQKAIILHTFGVQVDERQGRGLAMWRGQTSGGNLAG